MKSPSDSPWRHLPLLALAFVAALALRRLDDFDTWWHLASGRWIARNARVPATDTLSFTVPDNEWVNLQWLYDLLLYGAYRLGGADLLVLLSVACFAGAFALLATNVRRHLGPVATALLVAWVGAAVSERFLLRPEMATFPLLAGVQLLLARGRERPEGLRYLVPLMLLWANLHSLFVLGAAAIVATIAAALVVPSLPLPRMWREDGRWPEAARAGLLRWGGLALAATLVNPYGIRAWIFPLELMSRIDGSSEVYQVIGEFRPPFSGYFPTFAIGSYQIFVVAVVVLAVVAGAIRAFPPRRRRGTEDGTGSRFDVGALVFALALTWLSLLARRNIGVFALGAAPFLASAVAIVGARLAEAAPGGAARVLATRISAAAVTLGLLLGISWVATNRWYASTGETHEFGVGVFEANFPVRAVEFFRAQNLPGPTYNDMTAGGYLAWDDPTGRGVYIDGRLEVYDTPFFSAYLDNLYDGRAWLGDADRRGVQSVLVFHRWSNRQGFVRFLLGTTSWRLVYYDEVAAIFVRSKGHEETIAQARSAYSKDWLPRIESELSGEPRSHGWQWPVARYTALVAFARMLETLGERERALAYYDLALAGGVPVVMEVEVRAQAARHHYALGRPAQARRHLEEAARVAPGDATIAGMLGELRAAGH